VPADPGPSSPRAGGPRTLRILFTFAGGSGHLDPLVPIARAAASAGHVVAFAGRPWMTPVVEALGFTAFGTGSDVGLAPVRRPLLPVDTDREERDLRDGFARRIARERAADLLPLCRSWRPDVLVCEETDFGPMVVAEALGIPHATVVVLAAGSLLRPDVVGEPIDALRAAYGLRADPAPEMSGRHLVLSPFPPSLRDPAFPLPAAAHAIRPAALDEPDDAWEPRWAGRGPGRPLVYLTLGTVFPLESGDLFTRLLAGLEAEPIDVVVTVGRDLDPAELGPRPPNVRVERFIPQASVLPHCRLVVSHGGSGSVVGALAHGIPMVIVPMGADQPANAMRCAALGVARVLDPITATPADVGAAASAVLADPAYGAAAMRIRDECVSLPGPAHALGLVERIAGR
jgi:UDP:flavonoid glycosyltransferase YjiC (YdhE family)